MTPLRGKPPSWEIRRKTELTCTADYRNYQRGDRIRGNVSEDDLNFYWHDVNDVHPSGCYSNYLTLPKFAFINFGYFATRAEAIEYWRRRKGLRR